MTTTKKYDSILPSPKTAKRTLKTQEYHKRHTKKYQQKLLKRRKNMEVYVSLIKVYPYRDVDYPELETAKKKGLVEKVIFLYLGDIAASAVLYPNQIKQMLDEVTSTAPDKSCPIVINIREHGDPIPYELRGEVGTTASIIALEIIKQRPETSWIGVLNLRTSDRITVIASIDTKTLGKELRPIF